MSDFVFNMSAEDDVIADGSDMGNYWARKGQLNENCFMDPNKIEIGDWNGTAIMDIFWTNANGADIKQRLWGLTGPRDSTPEAAKAFEKKKKTFQKHIKHILTKYMTEENYGKVRAKLSGTMEQIFTVVKDVLIKVKAQNTKLRIKNVLNDDDFPMLPKYVPYLEPMTVPLEGTQLRFTDFDKVERTSVDSSSATSEEDVFSSDSGDSTDDLPF